ncbi:hypothetical protein Tco_1394565 [Tanacetum coccineum]
MAMFWPCHQMKKKPNSESSKDSPSNEYDDGDIRDEYSRKFIRVDEDSDKEEGFSKKNLVCDNFRHANTHSHVDNSPYGDGSSTNFIKEVNEKSPLSKIPPGFEVTLLFVGWRIAVPMKASASSMHVYYVINKIVLSILVRVFVSLAAFLLGLINLFNGYSLDVADGSFAKKTDVSCEGYLEDVSVINSMDNAYCTLFASIFKSQNIFFVLAIDESFLR